jgi:hypothetical protein
VVIEFGVAAATAAAYVLPGVRSMDARLRPAGIRGAEVLFLANNFFLGKTELTNNRQRAWPTSDCHQLERAKR